ncbi:MAG: DUF4255 domain-containing protein [Anaerolineales bacterium]
MSDSLAIAAVTTTLRNLLISGLNADLAGTTVTTRPLDRAREGIAGNQVNLFLYHAQPNAAWRNMDIPWKLKPGETGHSPLPLTLHYLITAFYGEDEDGVDTTTDANFILGTHRLLGRAMSVLHDHPLLDAAGIHSTLPPDDQLNHPYNQVERVRLTPQPLSLDEISKLWSGFQSQYRLSMAYEASVVLLESSRPSKTPLPVLRRGSQDQGVFTHPGLSPTLSAVEMPGGKPTAELGDTLTLRGANLEAGNLMVYVHHSSWEEPEALTPLNGVAFDTLKVKLPDTVSMPPVASTWPAGIYTVFIRVEKPDFPKWTSNSLPFALAPRITLTAPPGNTAPAGNVTVSLECLPQINGDQRIILLFGDREVLVDTLSTPNDPAAPSTLTFQVENVPPPKNPPTLDLYIVRLRVDGVDSIPVDFSTTPPQFAANQTVTITPS